MKRLKDKLTKGQTVIYKTLHRKLRIYNGFEKYHFFPMNLLSYPSFPLCIICKLYTQELFKENQKNLTRSFNLRFLSINMLYDVVDGI
jgi:hypothetical protein